MLIPPREGKPLKFYISATQESIGSLLAYDNEDGHEQAIFYLSRILNPIECKYSIVEKLCLALYFFAFKLRYYMLAYIVFVITQIDVIKYMLPLDTTFCHLHFNYNVHGALRTKNPKTGP